MAVTLSTSGSQTATINTEHQLANPTSAGFYQLVVDTSAMVNGDTVELRVYGKARSTDTEQLEDFLTFQNAQSRPLKRTLMYGTPHYVRLTLKQTAGTGRAFPWAVYSA